MTTFIKVVAALCLLAPSLVIAGPITYYDLDFEDGTLGGGIQTNTRFALPENVSPSNLDGRALEFTGGSVFQNGDVIVYLLNGSDSDLHHISFDYYAEPGAVVTNFLDIPQILRVDIRETGRHHVDLYYDISNQAAIAFLDGMEDSSLITILAWPRAPETRDVRFSNQTSLPSASRGDFQIDNFLWEGNVSAPPPPSVPEPSSLLLLGFGACSMLGYGKYQKMRRTKGKHLVD